jgi:acyl dehydratase
LNLADISFQVSDDVYQKFTSLSGDVHPLHTDKEFAKSKGFRDIVVQGNVLNSFISYIIGMHLQLENVMIINQNINFRKPIFIGDYLTFTLSIKDKLEFLPGVELSFKCLRNSENVASGTILIKTDL